VHIGLLRGNVKIGTLDLKYSFHAISPPVVELFVYCFYGCCNYFDADASDFIPWNVYLLKMME